MGIGPTRPAWKAGILPLNYTRTSTAFTLYIVAKKSQQFYTAFFDFFLRNFNFIFCPILVVHLQIFLHPFSIFFGCFLPTFQIDILFIIYIIYIITFVDSWVDIMYALVYTFVERKLL